MTADDRLAEMLAKMLQNITDFALDCGVSPGSLSDVYLQAALNVGARGVIDAALPGQDERIASLMKTDGWKSLKASHEAFLAEQIRDRAEEDVL